MKGMVKAIKRTPHSITTKVGFSKKSTDPVFDDYQRQFKAIEDATDKLIKDSKAFIEQTTIFFNAGVGLSTHLANIYQPLGGEYNLAGKHPDSADTINNVAAFVEAQEEIRNAIGPELELIEGKVIGPAKDFQATLKLVRKSITKREHKLTDYDRFNNSLTKLRDKKEKSLGDEKNLFKLEQDFEIATNEYDYINNALKNELPQFMILATRFIDPLFHSFFYMQLNVSYVLMEKLTGFAEGKYDVSTVPGNQITADYENNRTDAWETIEALNITHRIISTTKMVQSQRSVSGSTGPSSLSRSTTGASASTVGSRAIPPSAGGFKKAPPPPTLGSKPSFSKAPPAVASPPPYTASPTGSQSSLGAAAKRAPPPPPPLKSKPKMEPPVEYVVALYDFAAQAEGDLEFSVGDRIEVVERTSSAEDWWTGRLNGHQGSFPGNYVQDA